MIEYRIGRRVATLSISLTAKVIHCQIQTGVKIVVGERSVTVCAGGAPLVVALPLGGDLLVSKHNS